MVYFSLVFRIAASLGIISLMLGTLHFRSGTAATSTFAIILLNAVMGWNNLGVDGDAWAQVHVAGLTNISSSAEYQARIIGNNFIMCGTGRGTQAVIRYEDTYISSPEGANVNYVYDNRSHGVSTPLQLVDANPPAFATMLTYP